MHVLALHPDPFQNVERVPGTHCLHMYIIFLDFSLHKMNCIPCSLYVENYTNQEHGPIELTCKHSTLHLDYGNFKLTNQVARNEGSIFHSRLAEGSIVGRWPLVARSIETLVASGLNGHCPISFSAVV